jgi:hypothetical protein
MTKPSMWLAITVLGGSLLSLPAFAAGKNFRAAKQKARVLASGDVAVGQAGIVSIDVRKNNLITFADGTTARWMRNANARDYTREKEGFIQVFTPRGKDLPPVRRDFDVWHWDKPGTVRFSHTTVRLKNHQDYVVDDLGRDSAMRYNQPRGAQGRFEKVTRFR